MDRCVLLTSTPWCVVLLRGDQEGAALVIAQRGETTHSGVNVNNTHLSMINPLNPFMGCICATYEYNPWNRQWATDQTHVGTILTGHNLQATIYFKTKDIKKETQKTEYMIGMHDVIISWFCWIP